VKRRLLEIACVAWLLSLPPLARAVARLNRGLSTRTSGMDNGEASWPTCSRESSGRQCLLPLRKDSMPRGSPRKEESGRAGCKRIVVGRDSGVPGDARKLLLAGLPFVAGEDARGDVDQAGDEAEDGGGGPGAAVARAVIADV
jgi:hypothetical protein